MANTLGVRGRLDGLLGEPRPRAPQSRQIAAGAAQVSSTRARRGRHPCRQSFRRRLAEASGIATLTRGRSGPTRRGSVSQSAPKSRHGQSGRVSLGSLLYDPRRMLPLEFTIVGPPVSQQTRNRQRLQQWKLDVQTAARSCVPPGTAASPDDVEVTITYYYEGDSPDVDNIIKPIQDALNGVVFVDDAQVVQTRGRKKDLNGSYQIKGVSAVLLMAFSDGTDFLHIRVEEHVNDGVLD